MTEQTVQQPITPQTDTAAKPQGESPSLTAEQYREQGAQALSKLDIEAAIDSFSKALQAKITASGSELAPDCAPYYFDYGDAMLQQCSQKSDVFGGAMKEAQEKVAVEMIEETNNEDAAEDEDEESAEANENEAANDNEVANEEERVEEADTKDDGGDIAERNALERENNEAEDDDEEGGDDEPVEENIEDADEPTDLEVAWELLETARVIFSRMEKNEPSAVFGLADCYSRLGDLALENDTDALADYTQCLNTLNSITDEKSLSSSHLQIKYRALGAINFKMAIANSLTGESTNALSQFQDAQKALLKVAELVLGKAFTVGKSEAGSDTIPIDAIREAASSQDEKKQGEVDDLIDLLQKIQEKIEDLLVAEPMKSTEVTSIVNVIMADAAAAADVADGFEPSRDAAGDSSNVNDLGTIVGQKRKMTSEENESEQSAKVAKSGDA